MNDEEKLYKYHLDKSIERRNQALAFYKKGNITHLTKEYPQYLNGEYKEEKIDVDGLDINELLYLLNEIKSRVFWKSSVPTISTYTDDSFVFGTENYIVVGWNNYSIKDESICVKIAEYATKDALFKLKRQPNSKDAKEAKKILEQ